MHAPQENTALYWTNEGGVVLGFFFVCFGGWVLWLFWGFFFVFCFFLNYTLFDNQNFWVRFTWIQKNRSLKSNYQHQWITAIMLLSRAPETSNHRSNMWAACPALGPHRQNDMSVTQYFPVLSPFPRIVCIIAGCQIVFPHIQQMKWNCMSCSDTQTHNNFPGVTNWRSLCVRGSYNVPSTACHTTAVSYKGRAMSYQWTSQQFLGKREAVALFSHRLPHP